MFRASLDPPEEQLTQFPDLIFQNTSNPFISQPPIGNFASIAELSECDYFIYSDKLVQYCSEHNYVVDPGSQREWVLHSLPEIRFFPIEYEEAKSITLYARNSEVKLFQCLNYFFSLPHNKQHILGIHGSPRIGKKFYLHFTFEPLTNSSGKSTTVLGWMLHQSTSNQVPILWIHSADNKNFVLLRQVATGPQTYARVSSIDHLEAVITAENLSGFKVVCFDGNIGSADSSQILKYFCEIAKDSGCFTLVCSSGKGFDVSPAWEARYHVSRYLVDSWSFSEYDDMNRLNYFNHLNNGNPLTPVQLRKRYYVAGGSIYYFCQELERVKQIYKWTLDRVPAVDLLQGRFPRDGSALYSNFGGVISIVSGYLRNRLSEKADLRIVELFSAMAHNNPRFHRQINEFEMKTRIRICQRNGTKFNIRGESANHNFIIAGCVDYDDLTSIGFLRSNFVYFPMSDMNPGFDLVLYQNVHEIHHYYFMNVTAAPLHSFDYEECGNFLAAFHQLPVLQTRTMRRHPTNIHVHFYTATRAARYADTRVGLESSLNYIQIYDPGFTRAKKVYLT